MPSERFPIYFLGRYSDALRSLIWLRGGQKKNLEKEGEDESDSELERLKNSVYQKQRENKSSE
jgi:hypothetical protein